jgi:hypothetical protein
MWSGSDYTPSISSLEPAGEAAQGGLSLPGMLALLTVHREPEDRVSPGVG